MLEDSLNAMRNVPVTFITASHLLGLLDSQGRGIRASFVEWLFVRPLRETNTRH